MNRERFIEKMAELKAAFNINNHNYGICYFLEKYVSLDARELFQKNYTPYPGGYQDTKNIAYFMAQESEADENGEAERLWGGPALFERRVLAICNFESQCLAMGYFKEL